MPIAKFVVELPRTSGLPEDVVVNTFHFAVDDYSETIAEACQARLIKVYNDAVTGPNTDLAVFLSKGLVRTAQGCLVTAYPVGGASNDPYFSDTFTLDAGAGSNDQALPGEVALCGSYANDSVTTSPDRNRRGRVYFGPFSLTALDLSTTISRPSDDLIDTIVGALDRLGGDNDGDATWVVYSPTLGLSFPVERVFCDNAWDTQRRRGVAPTSRDTATI